MSANDPKRTLNSRYKKLSVFKADVTDYLMVIAMKKWFITFLLSLFGVKNVVADFNWHEDPIESVKGIHLLSDYGSGHQYLGDNLEISNVLSELRKLNWTDEFLQFIVVTEPGVSMEVGGSLNGIDGLSGNYRNRHNASEAVTINAPENVIEMEEILKSFLSPNDNSWQVKFDF